MIWRFDSFSFYLDEGWRREISFGYFFINKEELVDNLEVREKLYEKLFVYFKFIVGKLNNFFSLKEILKKNF